MKKFNSWNNMEIKKLFSFVEDCKKKNLSLTKIFALYASQSGRDKNSIRNYYYGELMHLQKNKELANSLCINLSLHKVKEQEKFKAEDEKALFLQIEEMKKSGVSVRSACLQLAKNDVSQMVRLQNKYRSMLKANAKMGNISPKKIVISNNDATNQNNILKMPQKQNSLTQSDIQSLFVGLVNLLKKQIADELKEQKYAKDNSAKVLRKVLKELYQKEQQLKDNREKFILLDKANQKLKEDNVFLKTENANFRAAEKNKNFVSFANKLAKNNQKVQGKNS